MNSRILNATALQSLGVAGASAISIASNIILARLYSPEDFGLLAVVVLSISLILPLATGRYEVAIFLPKNINGAANIAGLTVFIAAIFSLLVFLGIKIFPSAFPTLVGSRGHFIEMQNLVPIGIFLSALTLVLANLATREGYYVLIAFSRILGAIAVAAVSIVGGIYNLDGRALVYAYIFGLLLSSTIFLYPTTRSLIQLNIRIRPTIMIHCALTYISFPKVSVAADFLGIASRQAPLLIFSHLFGPAAAGMLSLCQRSVGAITSLIGRGIGEIFRKEAAADFSKLGNFRTVFGGFFRLLVLLAFIIFGALFFFGPQMFALAFGPEWMDAGVYARYLTPFYAAAFVGGNLGWAVYITEKQSIDLFFHGLIFVAGLASGLLGMFMGAPLLVLAFYSLSTCIIYIFYTNRSYQLSGGN